MNHPLAVSVIDALIHKLFDNLSHQTIVSSLFDISSYSNRVDLSNKPCCSFLNRSIDFCLNKWNVEQYFATIEDLLELLHEYKSNSALVECFKLCSYLEIEKKLDIDCKYYQVKKLSKCLFTEVNLNSSVSLGTLRLIAKHTQALLELKQFLTFNRWKDQIDGILEESSRCIEFLSHNKVLLRSISLYSAEIVNKLEEEGQFMQIISTNGDDFTYDYVESSYKLTKALIEKFPADLRTFLEVLNTDVQSKKSVLFEYYMSKNLSIQCDNGPMDMNKFVKALYNIYLVISRLFRLLPPQFSVAEMLDAKEVLEQANRPPEVELNILSTYFLAYEKRDNEIVNNTLVDLRTSLQLFSLINPLKTLVNDDYDHHMGFFKLYKFACFDNGVDGTFIFLQQVVKELSDDVFIASLDIVQCKHKIDEILKSLGNLQAIDKLLGIVSLFNCYAKATKVWEFFVNRPEYIAADCKGYNQVFDEKVEEFSSQLSGEDSKILENFRTVSTWTAILIAHKNSSFDQLLSVLVSSPMVTSQLELIAQDTKPFSQVLTAQEHMDFIEGLFQSGLSGLDMVLGQLKSIESNALYIFNLVTNQLSIQFLIPNGIMTFY